MGAERLESYLHRLAMPEPTQSTVDLAALEQIVLALPLRADLARRVIEDADRRRVRPGDIVRNALEGHFERLGSARGGGTTIT
jgi:hypothetical protein